METSSADNIGFSLDLEWRAATGVIMRYDKTYLTSTFGIQLPWHVDQRVADPAVGWQNHVHAASHQSVHDIAECEGLSHIPNQVSGSDQVNNHSALLSVPAHVI